MSRAAQRKIKQLKLNFMKIVSFFLETMSINRGAVISITGEKRLALIADGTIWEGNYMIVKLVIMDHFLPAP